MNTSRGPAATSPDPAGTTGQAPDAVVNGRGRAILVYALSSLLILSGIGTVAYALVDAGAPSRQTGPAGAARVEVDLRAPSRRPALLPAAEQPTEAGATAFVLFWFDALNYSLAHSDTDLLAGHTNAGCQQCTGYLIALQRWKDQGSALEGGLSVPVDLAIGGEVSTTEPVQFASTFLTSPAVVTDKDGRATSYPGGRTRGGVTVLFANGRWQVTDLVLDVRQAGPRP